jgi:hypothetical protein
MESSTSIKTVLRKLSNNEELNKQDKKSLKDFISVLKRALKDKSLSAQNRTLINETIKKSKKGILTPVDFFVIAGQIFQWVQMYKNSP